MNQPDSKGYQKGFPEFGPALIFIKINIFQRNMQESLLRESLKLSGKDMDSGYDRQQGYKKALVVRNSRAKSRSEINLLEAL